VELIPVMLKELISNVEKPEKFSAEDGIGKARVARSKKVNGIRRACLLLIGHLP
jgi:hypothetical protein